MQNVKKEVRNIKWNVTKKELVGLTEGDVWLKVQEITTHLIAVQLTGVVIEEAYLQIVKKSESSL